MKTVISLGGSIVVPDKVDTAFLRSFRKMMEGIEGQFIIVLGGGALARNYQEHAKASGDVSKTDLDLIGIQATKLNSEILRVWLGKDAHQEVIKDPTALPKTSRKFIICSGWKPGSSTDNVAVVAAEKAGAKTIINLSNIDHVYTADPRKDPKAKKLDMISWPDFRKLVGDAWDPGMNVPFDPVASRKAEKLGLEVVMMGPDLKNLKSYLSGKGFVGTRIGI